MQEIDYRDLPIKLSFVDKDYSRYTLFPILFKFSKVFLKFENRFSRYLKLNYKSKKYLTVKMANFIVSMISMGIGRFERLNDEFACETGLIKYLGFESVPHSTTVQRFLRVFNGYNIRQLERVNLSLLSDHKDLWYYPERTLFVDIDMNVKSLEGVKTEKAAYGYNRRRPGRKSLKWTIVQISQVALYSELHAGNVVEKPLLKSQLTKTEKLLSRMKINFRDNRKIVLRVDGGYVTYANLHYLIEQKYRFITRLRSNLKILKPIYKQIENGEIEWEKYSKFTSYTEYGNVDVEIEIPVEENDTNTITDEKSSETKIETITLRLVIIRLRKVRGKKTTLQYYPIGTNIYDWNPRSIVKSYRGRQRVENFFKDTNQAFHSSKLPSLKYYANHAFLWFTVLAYNQSFFFHKTRY